MPYKAEVDTARSIVLIEYFGEVSLTDRKEARAELVQLAKEHGIKRGLVDMRHCQMALSTMEIYEFGSTFDEAGLHAGIRIGGLILPHDEDDRFLEAVAGNRSATIKFFLNENEALKWLGVDSANSNIGHGALEK
jgi:hypothetical protein